MTTQAIKATITLGNIELDCYQMPDGQYKMTVTQTCNACNLDPKRFPQLLELKQVKALAQAGLVTPELVVKGKIETSDGIRQAKLIDLKLVSLIWRLGGTDLGQDLVDACLIEALERRADSAFGVVRTEQERQDKLEARIDHADGWRKNFTSWQKRDGCEVGQDYAIRVKELKSAARLPVEISIKDYTSKEVKIMTNAEVIYDAMRRKGLTHDEALNSL